jgi:hypothetical protein
MDDTEDRRDRVVERNLSGLISNWNELSDNQQERFGNEVGRRLRFYTNPNESTLYDSLPPPPRRRNNIEDEIDIVKIEEPGGGGTTIGALVVTIPETGKFSVTWGAVGGKIPSNVKTEISFSGTKQVWLEIEMQTVAPWAVVSTEVKQGAEMPEPNSPDPETGAPPSIVYFLLGEAPGPENTNGNTGGSLNVTLVKTGTVCRPAVEADPEADPPVLASEGGLTDILTWKVERQ